MADRTEELSELKLFIGKVDTEITMILQHLQWDRKHLIEAKPMVGCKYNENHKVPQENIAFHEKKCLLAKHGYSEEDVMLPEPFDTNVDTYIRLGKSDIKQIIDRASIADPTLKRGVSSTQVSESEDLEPLTFDRLQATYTADERQAIYNAVVTAAPVCHDVTDIVLLGENGEASKGSKEKSRLELLAEIRDMKRRRAKYRVAPKTRNYSDVLRDVINTQMEMYSAVKNEKMSPPVSPSVGREESNNAHHNQASGHSKYSNRDADCYKNDVLHDKRREKNTGRNDYYDHSSRKAQYTNDMIQYPEPRQYKRERYSHNESGSKISRREPGCDYYSDMRRRKHDEREIYDKDGSGFKKIRKEASSDRHRDTGRNRYYDERESYSKDESGSNIIGKKASDKHDTERRKHNDRESYYKEKRGFEISRSETYTDKYIDAEPRTYKKESYYKDQSSGSCPDNERRKHDVRQYKEEKSHGHRDGDPLLSNIKKEPVTDDEDNIKMNSKEERGHSSNKRKHDEADDSNESKRKHKKSKHHKKDKPDKSHKSKKDTYYDKYKYKKCYDVFEL